VSNLQGNRQKKGKWKKHQSENKMYNLREKKHIREKEKKRVTCAKWERD